VVRLLFLCALAGLCACGTGVKAVDDAGRDETDAGQSTSGKDLEVGTGSSDFEALTDGQSVQIIHGPQGGYHVWAALRASRSKVAPERAQVYARLSFNGTELSANGYSLNLVEVGDFYEWYGLQALIPDPTAVDGQTVLLRLELTDSTGFTATDERRLVPHQ
jgi:hypothetical protein